MAHQDFGTICPIFTEGVEKELVFQVRASGCVSVDQAGFVFGREVTVIEAYALFATGSLSTSACCSIGIYKGTLSTRIGSINCTQSAFNVAATQDIMPSTIAGSVTSTSFTSTDVLCIAVDGKNSGSVYKPYVYIRYREK